MSMIRPDCSHDRKDVAPSMGWIFSCAEDFEHAVRRNLLKYADCLTTIRLEKDLLAARATIQKQAEDIEDMKLSRRTAFIRCSCGRLRELNLDCRGCGT